MLPHKTRQSASHSVNNCLSNESISTDILQFCEENCGFRRLHITINDRIAQIVQQQGILRNKKLHRGSAHLRIQFSWS